MANEDLKQTKNAFKVIGKVTRIDKDGAYEQDEMSKGNREGDTYRKLRFGVKTSETNEITVGTFDYEPEEIFMWNSDKAKKEKEEGRKYKGKRVSFEDWKENKDQYKEEGYAVLQTRVGLTFDKKGKIKSEGLPRFVASKEIYDQLSNGDSVVIEGDIRYSNYENQQGQMVEQKSFTIEKAFKLKDIDFEDEKFEEITYFEQEMVFIDAEPDKQNKKVYITGRVIDYKKNFHDTQFVIDYSDGDGTNSDMVKLAQAFLKKFKFGDLIKVYGDTLNRVVLAEVDESDDDKSEEDKLIEALGGKPKPKHAQAYVSRTYISEMQIHGLEAWDKKVYKESDFIVDNLLDEDEDEKGDLSNELGGKKKKNTNPFDLDDDDDIDGDDLPF